MIPGELPTASYRGEPGDALGAGVSLDEGRVLVGAPGAGAVLVLDHGTAGQGPVGLGRWVWWLDGAPVAARAEDGVYRLDADPAVRVVDAPGALVYAAGEMDEGPRIAAASASDVSVWDGDGQRIASLALTGVQRLAIGARRLLMVRCEDGACDALAWEPGADQPETLGEAGDGGAVMERDGVAWWGDPELEQDAAAGRVCDEDGRCLDGIEGDHLGRSLCDGFAAGVYNTWTVPARLRLVSLDEGPTLAVDRAPASRPPALHRDGDSLAIGLPMDGLHERGEGRVLVVALSGLEADDLLLAGQ